MTVSWEIKKDYDFSDSFKKIIRFYLLECPLEADSRRYSSQAEISKWNSRSLERRLIGSSGLSEATWRIASKNNMNNELEKLGILKEIDPAQEIAIHTRSNNYAKPLALIHMIRCSFAHGNFSQRSFNGGFYYLLENTDKGDTTGRALLYEKTLLDWMKIIKDGPISNS